MTDEPALEEVARRLGYRFRNPELLRDALTHRSLANERPELAPRDNERLEFLGDAVLDLVASMMLWEAFPEAPEGELTRRRADLVCESGLAGLAQDIELGGALRLGRGEERSGGRDKPRLLASAFEACMGAVLLDGGPEAALDVGRRLFGARLHATMPGARDYKSRVQERMQAAGRGTPKYVLRAVEGPDHERQFHVAIVLEGETLAEGWGRSKSEAEQAAAEAALEELGADSHG